MGKIVYLPKVVTFVQNLEQYLWHKKGYNSDHKVKCLFALALELAIIKNPSWYQLKSSIAMTKEEMQIHPIF